MQLTGITIRDFKAVEDLEIRPKALNILLGSNGTGKTSVLDAIADVFEGGHAPERIRHGAKKAEITLYLRDDKTGYTVKKSITPKTSTVTVTPDGGEPLKSPASWLKDLANGVSFDPIQFAVDKKTRVAFVAEVMPLEFTSDEIVAAVREAARPELHAALGENPPAFDLSGLRSLRETLYTERTRVNAREKQSSATAERLRATLREAGDGDDKDWKAEFDRADQELTTLQSAKNGLLREVDIEEQRCKQECATLRDETIEVARKAFEQACAAARALYDGHIAAIQRDAATARQDIHEQHAAKIEAVSQARTVAQDRQSASAATGELKRQLDDHNRAARELSLRSMHLSDIIESLDGLRVSKTSAALPAGTEIVDGDLVVDGIPFDELNTAKQYELALTFAGQRPNKLGLMICDRTESFDDANWELFKGVAATSGFTIFAARVAHGEEPKRLTVETVG